VPLHFVEQLPAQLVLLQQVTEAAHCRLVGRRLAAKVDPASASAKEMPARTRISAVFSMPSFAAIWSAVRKRMPRMSRAKRYGFSEISRMAKAERLRAANLAVAGLKVR
jgi:hypothetical protein